MKTDLNSKHLRFVQFSYNLTLLHHIKTVRKYVDIVNPLDVHHCNITPLFRVVRIGHKIGQTGTKWDRSDLGLLKITEPKCVGDFFSKVPHLSHLMSIWHFFGPMWQPCYLVRVSEPCVFGISMWSIIHNLTISVLDCWYCWEMLNSWGVYIIRWVNVIKTYLLVSIYIHI